MSYITNFDDLLRLQSKLLTIIIKKDYIEFTDHRQSAFTLTSTLEFSFYVPLNYINLIACSKQSLKFSFSECFRLLHFKCSFTSGKALLLKIEESG